MSLSRLLSELGNICFSHLIEVKTSKVSNFRPFPSILQFICHFLASFVFQSVDQVAAKQPLGPNMWLPFTPGSLLQLGGKPLIRKSPQHPMEIESPSPEDSGRSGLCGTPACSTDGTPYAGHSHISRVKVQHWITRSLSPNSKRTWMKCRQLEVCTLLV